MAFVITNSKNYVKGDSGNPASTTHKVSLAKLFETREKAEQFCRSLPKSMKHLGYYVADYSVESTGEYTTFSNPVDSVIEYVDFDPSMIDADYIIGEVRRFEEFINRLISHKADIRRKQEYAEAQIFDIEHAAEQQSLDVMRGYKLYKLLHDARKVRRDCKNSLKMIGILETCVSSDFLRGSICGKLSTVKEADYIPRVLGELFDKTPNFPLDKL